MTRSRALHRAAAADHDTHVCSTSRIVPLCAADASGLFFASSSSACVIRTRSSSEVAMLASRPRSPPTMPRAAPSPPPQREALRQVGVHGGGREVQQLGAQASQLRRLNQASQSEAPARHRRGRIQRLGADRRKTLLRAARTSQEGMKAHHLAAGDDGRQQVVGLRVVRTRSCPPAPPGSEQPVGSLVRGIRVHHDDELVARPRADIYSTTSRARSGSAHRRRVDRPLSRALARVSSSSALVLRLLGADDRPAPGTGASTFTAAAPPASGCSGRCAQL